MKIDVTQEAYKALAQGVRIQVLEQLTKLSSESLSDLFDVRVNYIAPDYFDEDAQQMRRSANPRIDVFIKPSDAESARKAKGAAEIFFNKCKKAKSLKVDKNTVTADDSLVLVTGINSVFSPSVRKIEIPKILTEGRGNAVA